MRIAGGQAVLVRVGVAALVAIGCADDGDRRTQQRASRALVQTFTMSCSSLASGAIGSGQSVATLATAELTGSTDAWTSYVELSPATHIVCNYNLPAGIVPGTITSLSVDVNYRGPTTSQLWTFQVLDTTTGAWVLLGNNSFATSWIWTKHTFTLPAPLGRFFSASGLMQIRYGSDSNADASNLDQMFVRGTADTGAGGGAGTTGRGGTTGSAGTTGRGGTSGTAGTTGIAGATARGGTTGSAGASGAGGSGGGGAAFSMACSSLASGRLLSGQSVATLATAELTGSRDVWANYVEVEPATQIVCNYNLPASVSAGSVTSMALQVNYRGPSKTSQVWTFEVRDATTGAWISVGDNGFATGWTWTPHTFVLPAPLARYFTGGTLQIRYGTTSNADASNIDQMLITANGGSAGTGGSGGAGGRAGSPGGVCGSTSPPPARYDHVVVFSFENRTWSNVGLGFSSPAMPYLRALAAQCSYFSDWTETNTQQDSLTQYIGATSGVNNPNTVNDCDPSATCRSTDDNLFRQVRRAGGTARNYVEGATAGCSDGGNAAKHIPALYFYGTYSDANGAHNDHDFCNAEVRPYTELDVDNLPTFAWISPNGCNDGHDCADSVVDSWASANIQRVLDSAAYRAGTVAVFVWYDEDYPTPNAQIAPTSRRGNITQRGVGSHAALLKTIEDMLALPTLNQGQVPAAANLRSLLGM